MKHRLTKLFALLFTVCIISAGAISPALAQEENDDVQSLPEILNQPHPGGVENKHAPTSADLARTYYRKCISKESLVFTGEEKEILCSCTASGMATTLTAKEITHIEKKTRTGNAARDKFRAHAYAPCMEYVVDDKIRYECYKSKTLKDIIIGKKAICNCATDRFRDFLNRSASTIIIEAAKREPMTLNPLETFFIHGSYEGQRDYLINECYDKFKYRRDNK